MRAIRSASCICSCRCSLVTKPPLQSQQVGLCEWTVPLPWQVKHSDMQHRQSTIRHTNCCVLASKLNAWRPHFGQRRTSVISFPHRLLWTHIAQSLHKVPRRMPGFSLLTFSAMTYAITPRRAARGQEFGPPFCHAMGRVWKLVTALAGALTIWAWHFVGLTITAFAFT
jgi:hypothetical protein